MNLLLPYLSRNAFVTAICFVLLGVGILPAADPVESAAPPTAEVEISPSVKSKMQGTDVLKRYGTFDVPTKSAERADPSSPRVMAIGDFDNDGVDDLVVARGRELELHHGNINAFAPRTEEAWEAIRDLRFISPFDSETTSFALPAGADYLAVGDFDRDSRLDIAAAARGANELFFLRGNGKGGFISPQSVELTGQLTVMAAGDVNRPDGLVDLVVGIDGGDGIEPTLQVFDSLGDVLTVTMTDGNGQVRTAITKGSGNYLFTDVSPGGIYVFSVRAKGYRFGDPQVLTIAGDLTDLNFTMQR